MSSSQRRIAKDNLSALQAHLDELKENMRSDSRPYKSTGQSPTSPVGDHSEVARLRQSMANMMDLFMGELDGLKKDLYVDFGEAQRLIAADICQIRADLTQTDLRLGLVEKQRGKGHSG